MKKRLGSFYSKIVASQASRLNQDSDYLIGLFICEIEFKLAVVKERQVCNFQGSWPKAEIIAPINSFLGWEERSALVYFRENDDF